VPLQTEVDYWESRAKNCVDPDRHAMADNIWKRPEQIRRLLKYDFIDQKVLEIGVGNGLISGAIRMLVGGVWKWTGTELSPRFARYAAQMFGLMDIVQADVREIPGDGYTRIIALDALEHVRPEHRGDGYRRIAEVAADGALLFIHFSWGKSAHEKEFDHPFGLSDIVALEGAGFTLMSYERYTVAHPKGPIDYAFVVMRK
jgi:hypothetical protein